MKIYKSIAIVWLLLGVGGCQSTSTVGYLDDHPDFSPIVSRKGKTEYQVIWARSWKPVIYIKAYLESDEFEENKKAFVAYSFSEHHVKRLKNVEISLEKWNQIVGAIEKSSFWSYENRCGEQSYQKRIILLENGDGCEEIITLDGSLLTIAASENGRSKGVSFPLPGDNLSNQFIEIPKVLLRSIGKEKFLD